MPRMPWGASVNPPGYLGLGAETDRNQLNVIAGPVARADLNTPWTKGHIKRRGKLGGALRRQDFQMLARRGKRNAMRPMLSLGFGDASGLGFAPLAVPAALKVGGVVAKGVTSLFGHPKDAGRLRTNADLANKAAAGDSAALAQLRRMSGLDPGAGWATAKAKNDARRKYQAIVTQQTGLRPNIVPAQDGLQTTVSNLPPVAQAALKALTTGTAMDAALFSTPDIANTSSPSQAAVQVAQERVAEAQGPTLAGMNPMTLGMIAVGAYFLLGKKGRR